MSKDHHKNIKICKKDELCTASNGVMKQFKSQMILYHFLMMFGARFAFKGSYHPSKSANWKPDYTQKGIIYSVNIQVYKDNSPQ